MAHVTKGNRIGTKQERTKKKGIGGTLRPSSEAYDRGTIDVGDGQLVYYEQHGNRHGRPALVVHGGPGAGCHAKHATFFDPGHYRVILMDQRGCGRSVPKGTLRNNTTQHLVEDMRRLREHLDIDAWILFGGSWGVTLSLAYACKYPEHVDAMLLRGICLMRPIEIDWTFRGGASMLRPAAWDRFLSHLDEDERKDPLNGYYQRLLSEDADVREAAARAWQAWEMSLFLSPRDRTRTWDGQRWDDGTTAQRPPPATTSGKSGSAVGSPSTPGPQEPPPSPVDRASDPIMSSSAAQAMLTAHYSMHHGFMEPDYLLQNVDKFRHVPTIMVHGMHDLVCPLRTMFDLHDRWPEAQVRIVSGGHSMYDDAVQEELVRSLEEMREWKPIRPGPAF